MKNNIYRYLIMMIAGLIILPSCSDWDEYKMYIDKDRIYPQKPDSLKTRPGKNRVQLEWIISDPKVKSFKVLYSQEGVQDSVIVPVSLEKKYSIDTVKVIVDNLIESNCIFNVISYDALGNASLTVEAEEMVYGENYEKSLLNRVMLSKSVDTEGLHLNWYPPTEDTELGIEITYKDESGNTHTYFIADSISSSTIAGYDVNYPFTYRTKYLPSPTAIDTFYSAVNQDQIIFASELVNTERPFQITDRGWWFDRSFGDLLGWVVNTAAARNGTVDNRVQQALVFWSWPGYSPSNGIINGKIYQTLKLNAGSYTFKVTALYTSGGWSPIKQYIAVNKGVALPNVDKVEAEALSWKIIGMGLGDGSVITCSFTLEEASVVSLGIVGTIGSAQELRFKKFELIKN